MLASMIFRKEPFFHGHDNYDQVRAGPVQSEYSQHNKGFLLALLSGYLKKNLSSLLMASLLSPKPHSFSQVCRII